MTAAQVVHYKQFNLRDALDTTEGEGMKNSREKWIPPQLIVLGRGTPEENVLAGCKTSKNSGQAAKIVSCTKYNAAKTKCNGGNCNTISKTS